MRDHVIDYLEHRFLALGFQKTGKTFVLKLAEATAELQIQNHSFGAAQHLLNLTVTFDADVCTRENLVDNFATWARVESLDMARQLENLAALDAASATELHVRHTLIDVMLEHSMADFLSAWSTFDGAHQSYTNQSSKHAPINYVLSQRWSATHDVA